MFARTRFVVAGLALALFTACEHNPMSPARQLTTLEKRLVETDNRFGLKLFQAVAAADPEANVFLSPLSAAMALGMALNGADGETRAAMEQTLELAGLTSMEINESYRSLIDLLHALDRRVDFRLANSIWYRLGLPIAQAFVQTNRTYFDAVVQGLDFADPRAPDVINAWVRKHTNGRIDKMVEQIEDQTVMFLLNAIYFKGTWTYEFDPNDTRDDTFNRLDGTPMPIKMMHLTGELPYTRDNAAQIVELPYGNDFYSMLVVLPRPDVRLDSLVAELDAARWQAWIRALQPLEVDLSLPRFKTAYEVSLKDALKALGMALAFDPERANFMKMVEGRLTGNLYISEVKHKSFVQVDEEGTEAAAATSVEIGVTSAPRTVVVRVDRPFLFVIREKHSGTILFIGQITQPRFE